MIDKDWRPFEPCLENMERARTEGYVFCSYNFTQQEAHIVAESSKWMNDIKNPTLLPAKRTLE